MPRPVRCGHLVRIELTSNSFLGYLGDLYIKPNGQSGSGDQLEMNSDHFRSVVVKKSFPVMTIPVWLLIVMITFEHVYRSA